MKRTIQIALAALLLGLAAGCRPECTSEDGQHKWGKWSPIGISAMTGDVVCERTCETCGWTERSMGE